MVPSPTLYRLAANREYDSIPSRVLSHPEDILWTDRYGSTCLHILCQARMSDDALLRAVQSIIRHRPDVVAWPNVATWTPLHFAVERRFDGTASNNGNTTTPALTTTTTTVSTALNNQKSFSTTRRNIIISSDSNDSNYSQQQQQQEEETQASSNHERLNENNAQSQSSFPLSSHLRNKLKRRLHRDRHDANHNYLSTCTRLVLLLVDACPHAVSVRTKTGFKTKTPFHIACEADADYRILRAMLRINPSLAVQPFVQSSDVYAAPAENPLQLLWKNHHYNNSSSSKDSNRTNDNRSSDRSNNGHTLSNNQELKVKMALLLQAAHCGSVQHMCMVSPCSSYPQQIPFRLLNAACSVRCPKDYVAQILKEHADQVMEKDEKGLLPLHYAVRNAELDSQTYTQFIVHALLEIHPQAASVTDEDGRLPLHVAVGDVGLTWHKGGVQELTLQYTNALRTVDPKTGLLPFLQSARHAIHSRLHLSTTLELLLAAPEMVRPRKQTEEQELPVEKWREELCYDEPDDELDGLM